MKKLFTTCFAAMLFFTAYAQKPDKALARVRYTYIHMEDTTQKEKLRKENMLLVTGNNASVYTSYDKINQGINMRKQMQEQMKNQAGNGSFSINVKSESKGPITQSDYYYFADEHKLITKERLVNNYLIEEKAPVIDWKIQKDTMNFSGIHCQKATTYFKGRNWIAWFATEIPFQSGPWKLNGLPGLIVEAYDEKKEVKFEFAGLENINQEAGNDASALSMPNGGTLKVVGMDMGNPYFEPEIKLPEDGIKTTRKELDKLKEARDKDPQGFMQAQMAANGIQGSFKPAIAGRPAGTIGPISRPKINNPIELPEKK